MFEYLQKFVVANASERKGYNYFIAVRDADIDAAERRLGLQFPNQLRTFYKSVGFGALVEPIDKPGGKRKMVSNVVLHPTAVADIKEGGGDYPSEYEFSRAELPFFRIWESSYLTMNCGVEADRAIYYSEEIVVAKDLSSFMERLSIEPVFYEKLIEEGYRSGKR